MPQYRTIPLNPSPSDLGLPALPKPAWVQQMEEDNAMLPATIQGQPKQAEKPDEPAGGGDGKAKANELSFKKTAPSYSNSSPSNSTSNSSSRSYDYSGYDDHLKRQDALANARDAKKAALYDGDVKSSMLAGNKVRELVNYLRRDAPGTTEENPYQFKGPLSRVSSESVSTSRSGGGGSSSYQGPTKEMSVPANGGRGAAGGQQVPAGTPLSLPLPPMPAPAVFNGIDGGARERKEVIDDPRQPVPTTPEQRWEMRMRQGMIA